MFAISFDMSISSLVEYYGRPYNRAYYEIKRVLRTCGFEWIQGSTYLSRSEDMSSMILAISTLSKIDWFKRSVRDIRGYRVENWSNFTNLVKTLN